MVALVQQGLVGKQLTMSVRRDKRNGNYFYRKWVRTPDGRKVRVFGTPKADGLPETRAGAEEAERRAIYRVLNTGEPKKLVAIKKEVPTVREFPRGVPRGIADQQQAVVRRVEGDPLARAHRAAAR